VLTHKVAEVIREQDAKKAKINSDATVREAIGVKFTAQIAKANAGLTAEDTKIEAEKAKVTAAEAAKVTKEGAVTTLEAEVITAQTSLAEKGATRKEKQIELKGYIQEEWITDDVDKAAIESKISAAESDLTPLDGEFKTLKTAELTKKAE
jgi:chromosome segregation ATPase